MTTAVVESERRVAFAGDLKFIVIQSDGASEATHTIDLNTDATDAKETVVGEIYLTLVQNNTGRDFTATWDPATGIITMGADCTTAATHNIFIVGR